MGKGVHALAVSESLPQNVEVLLRHFLPSLLCASAQAVGRSVDVSKIAVVVVPLVAVDVVYLSVLMAEVFDRYESVNAKANEFPLLVKMNTAIAVVGPVRDKAYRFAWSNAKDRSIFRDDERTVFKCLNRFEVIA